jgi:hypothetical protein
MSVASTRNRASSGAGLPVSARVFAALTAAGAADPRPEPQRPLVPEPEPVPHEPPGPVIVPEPEPVPHEPPGPVIVPEPSAHRR